MTPTVFLSIGSEFLHGGHIAIIEKAAALGSLTVGVLSDEVLMTSRGCPVLSFEERCKIVSNIKGVDRVVKKDSTGYESIIQTYHPEYIVHGDRWQGNAKENLLQLLRKYGGQLKEFPYSVKNEYEIFDKKSETYRSTPDARRGRLRRALHLTTRPLRVMEAHNGLTGIIVEKTRVDTEYERRQFDAIWISSLCDSVSKGKPDIGIVDMTSRESTINEIMEVTTKPIILDGDSGGLVEHFVYTVRTLERIGVSAVIIEDKTGLKRNSLFGTDAGQKQDEISQFCAKIQAGKQAQLTPEFMIIARIESLILKQGMEDAIRRADAYVKAGADGIMIHSSSQTPDEVLEFCRKFRSLYSSIPLVVVPTTYCSISETELGAAGVNIVIYANHLIRSAFPAMQKTAREILCKGRAFEADTFCMTIKDILTLI